MNQSPKIETYERDGHTLTFIGEFNPWKYGEAMAAIASKRYGVEVTITNVIRKEDGTSVPR